jgi:hypothetical protein
MGQFVQFSKPFETELERFGEFDWSTSIRSQWYAECEENIVCTYGLDANFRT